jgi:spore coat polysaccharide biosynthesis predicted glycosyltransferase SpsG
LLIAKNDVALLDVLSLDNEKIISIKEACRKLFIVDDIGKEQYWEYNRIDWSIRSYVKSKKSEKNHLVSPYYVPLRDTFSNFPKKIIEKNVKRILITLGGSDIKNLTPKIIDFLKIKFPELKITVLVGPGFQHVDKIIETYNDNIDFKIRPNDEEIANAMKICDVAITTGGHTMYELAAAGLPVIQLQVADNQEVSKYWAEYGFSRYIGCYDSAQFWNNFLEAMQSFMSQVSRKVSSRLGQRLIDGKGSYRLIEKMIEKMVESNVD